MKVLTVLLNDASIVLGSAETSNPPIVLVDVPSLAGGVTSVRLVCATHSSALFPTAEVSSRQLRHPNRCRLHTKSSRPLSNRRASAHLV